MLLLRAQLCRAVAPRCRRGRAAVRITKETQRWIGSSTGVWRSPFLNGRRGISSNAPTGVTSATRLAASATCPLLPLVAAQVPLRTGRALTDLARSLPDEVMEKIADSEGGLKAFVAARPETFHLERRAASKHKRSQYWVRLRTSAVEVGNECALPASPAKAPAFARGAGDSRISLGGGGRQSAAGRKGNVLAFLMLRAATERVFGVRALWPTYRFVACGPPATSGCPATPEAASAAAAAHDFAHDFFAVVKGEARPSLRVRLFALVEAFAVATHPDGRSDTEVLCRFRTFPLSAEAVGEEQLLGTYADLLASYVQDPASFANMSGDRLLTLPFMTGESLPITVPCGAYRLSFYMLICDPETSGAAGSNSAASPERRQAVGQMGSWVEELFDFAGGFPAMEAERILRERHGSASVDEDEAVLASARRLERVWRGELAAALNSPSGGAVEAQEDCLEAYNVLRVAQVMKVDTPTPLPKLSEQARQLSAQPLGRVLALWEIAETRGQEAAAAAVACAGMLLLERDPTAQGWVVAAAFRLDMARHVPSLAQTLPRKDVAAKLAAVTDELRVVRSHLAARKSTASATGRMASPADVFLAEANVLLSQASERTRIGLLNKRSELKRCLAIQENGLTPLLHPQVLALAVFDAMPQLTAEAGDIPRAGRSSATAAGMPMVALSQLRHLLPREHRDAVHPSLQWARQHPHLFHCVMRGFDWFVVRRDVHEALLVRHTQERGHASPGANGVGGDGPSCRGGSAASGEDETALYDHNAGLKTEEEILQLVVSLLACHLASRRHCVTVPPTAFLVPGAREGPRTTETHIASTCVRSDEPVRAVIVEKLWASIPKAVRTRLRRRRAGTSFVRPASQTSSTGDVMDRFVGWLRESPEIFMVSAPRCAGGGHSGKAVPSLVCLTPAYNPLSQ